MKTEQPVTLLPEDQTEEQARQAVRSACQELDSNGLGAASLLSMAHRWKRSGARGLLTTPALPIDSWDVESIAWHALVPEPDQAEPWPGEPPSSGRAINEPWLGVYRGLLNEFGATQTILLLSPPYASALACLPRVQSKGLPVIHPALAALGPGGVPCVPFIATGTASLDQDALKVIVPALAASHVCLLSNLGVLVMGESARQAVHRAKSLEELARIYSLSIQMGDPLELDAAAFSQGLTTWQHQA